VVENGCNSNDEAVDENNQGSLEVVDSKEEVVVVADVAKWDSVRLEFGDTKKVNIFRFLANFSIFNEAIFH
jgi:hypothetical protein